LTPDKMRYVSKVCSIYSGLNAKGFPFQVFWHRLVLPFSEAQLLVVARLLFLVYE